MSLASVFSAVKTQLLAKVANASPFTQAVTADNTLAYVQMWNNQLASWRDAYKQVGDDEQITGNNNTYIPGFPAIMIEFAPPINNTQLGGGVQIYDDLTVRVHIVHEQLDAGDGTMEQNLEVYALADAVYAALQKFRPAGCVEFIRGNHGLDSNHDSLYHYIMDFGTNYVDAQQAEPIGGTSTTIKKVTLEMVNGGGELTDENNNPVTDENDNPILTS